MASITYRTSSLFLIEDLYLGKRRKEIEDIVRRTRMMEKKKDAETKKWENKGGE